VPREDLLKEAEERDIASTSDGFQISA